MAVRKGRVIKCLPYHEQWWAPRKYDIGSGKPIALLKARENLAKAGALPDESDPLRSSITRASPSLRVR